MGGLADAAGGAFASLEKEVSHGLTMASKDVGAKDIADPLGDMVDRFSEGKYQQGVESLGKALDKTESALTGKVYNGTLLEDFAKGTNQFADAINDEYISGKNKADRRAASAQEAERQKVSRQQQMDKAAADQAILGKLQSDRENQNNKRMTERLFRLSKRGGGLSTSGGGSEYLSAGLGGNKGSIG